MKIPRTIIVGDKVYKIRKFKHLRDNFADIDHNNHIVRIQYPDKELRNTILHEIIHLVEHYFRLKLTEKQVSILANGLRMIMLANHKFINVFRKGKEE